MECVSQISFIEILNVPNVIFRFIWLSWKDGQKGIFSVRRISEFDPSDFEWIIKIFLCILNLTVKSRILFVGVLKIVDEINRKVVLMAQTPLSKYINGTGCHLD